MKSNNAKSLAFDAALLTYSSTLVIYLAWLTLHWVDGSIPAPNQEFSVPNMGPLTLCILGILLTSTAVIQRLRRLNIATPGTVLFSLDNQLFNFHEYLPANLVRKLLQRFFSYPFIPAKKILPKYNNEHIQPFSKNIPQLYAKGTLSSKHIPSNNITQVLLDICNIFFQNKAISIPKIFL